MSSKNEFLNNAMKRMEDLISKGQELEGSTTRTERKVSNMSKMLTEIRGRLEKDLAAIAKSIGTTEDAVVDVVKAFVNLKVVPDELAAITKYQNILTRAVKDYSAAIGEGYDNAVKFLNANKKEYTEAKEANKKLIEEYEKRIAAGEKLTQKEQKKLNLAKRENAEMIPLLDSYRKERKEIDAAAKAKEADAKASQKKGEATKEAAAKGKKATEAELKLNKELSQSLRKVLEDVNAIRTALNSNGGLNIKINNAGFTRVLNEMTEAIDRFHDRAEGGTPRKKNFFDQVLGTREENKKSVDDIAKDAKSTIAEVKNQFIDPLGSTMTAKISKAISQGIRSGIQEGILESSNINPTYSNLANLATGMNLSQLQRRRLLMGLVGKKDETEIESAEIKAKMQRDASRYESREETKRQLEKYRTHLDFELSVNPGAVNDRIEAKARREIAEAKYAELKIEKELNKEKRESYNREVNEREQVRIEKEMSEVYGEEGTKIRKLGEELVQLQAKRRQILIQGEELNKINFAELANNTRRIQETTRKWAVEAYNVRHHVEGVHNTLKVVQSMFTRLASMTQTLSAAISAASGIWSNMRSAATSFFRYFTNGFRRAFSYVRNLATSTLQAGIEQRQKIEQAQIGFASFFGADRVDAVTQRVRQEAMKTPIVDAGSLADYVQQLAPVSQGNASLAINASLGILKSLVYSGSDISEGEYVIKNIRDVIAKGKATAIDIRQFNRALPGLEQALRESGQEAFLDKEGKLNITSKNVGQVLDLFAKLNTDANSPLKDIEEKQLRTLTGLEQLFTEKKTTAMENILQKSGFFDLMYDTLGLATDDSKWNKIVDFFGKVLQPIVAKVDSVISSINWDELGNNLSEFFSVVGEGVKEAKSLVFGALGDIFGGSDTKTLIHNAAGLIKSFIVGFGKGIKDLIDIISFWLKKLSGMFAGGDINKFVEMVGHYLISPVGKFIQMMFSLSQNTTGMISRIFANISSMSKGLDDLWLWANSKGATSYANRVVSNLTVKDMTAAQLQQALQGKAVTANGKDLAAAATGTALLGAETTKTSDIMSKFKDKATSATTAFTKFAVKLSGAVMAGGVVNSLLSGVSSLLRSTNEADHAARDWANYVDMMNGVLTGAVAGGILGGAKGGLIGAAAGAAVALWNLTDAANKKAKSEHDTKIEKIEDDQRREIYNGIMAAMKAKGINADTGSDEGFYADQKLKQYLNSTDPKSINYQRAADIFTNALRFKNTAEQLVSYTSSDEFKNAGGTVMDMNVQSERRDKLAEMVRWFRLNGDSFDYEGSSNESVIRSYLNGGTITDKQADLLLKKWSDLDITEAEETTELSKNIAATNNNTDKADEASRIISDTKASVESLEKSIRKADENLRKHYLDESVPVLSWVRSLVGLVTGDLNPDSVGLADNAKINVNGEAKIATIDDVKSAIKERINELGNQYSNETDPKRKAEIKEEISTILGALHWASEDHYKNNSSAFINDYINSLPWLIDYLRKILSKYAGGFINPIHRATGGLGVDTVPAMLQPGEFVMRRASVAKAGLSTMFALNRGDMAAAARSLGTRFSNSYNNSRNWNSVVNNNQKSQKNFVQIFNRNKSGTVSSYYGMANRIALS